LSHFGATGALLRLAAQSPVKGENANADKSIRSHHASQRFTGINRY